MVGGNRSAFIVHLNLYLNDFYDNRLETSKYFGSKMRHFIDVALWQRRNAGVKTIFASASGAIRINIG